MKLFFLLWILPLTLGDTRVTCIYTEECMLPCTSTNLDIIHWYKDKNAVHSFYHNQDQLGHQHADYKGRTSLLPESEIKNGNLSLLIRNISLQDEGRYKCYAATEKTNDEKFVDVSVEAPAKSVNITLNDDTVICSTSGVYPKPKVLWSSDPPAKELPTNVSQTEDQLFTVTSQLNVEAITDTYTYNCSITTNKYSYTASLKQQVASELSANEFFFKCPVTKDFNYSLTLRFSDTILTYDRKTSMEEISEQWRDKVTFHREDGSIKLSHLNQEQLGTYTCESTTAQYRYITQTKVQSSRGLGNEVYIIICIGIVLAILLIALIVCVVKKKRKKRRPDDAENSRETSNSAQEMEELNKSKD